MKKGIFAVSMLAYMISFLSMAQANSEGRMLDLNLNALRWKNRILILFSPYESHPSFQLQKDDLASRSQEVSERDLVIVEILEHGDSRALNRVLSEKDAQGIRDRFGVSPGRFQVILIGKDGGVKLRSEQAVPAQDIFGLIDSMPMRRQEMDGKTKP
jgi:hypothetical protein